MGLGPFVMLGLAHKIIKLNAMYLLYSLKTCMQVINDCDGCDDDDVRFVNSNNNYLYTKM